MLNYRSTNVFFFALGLFLLVIHVRYVHLSWIVPALFLFDYSLIQFYGSYFIQANFHIKSVCRGATSRKEVSITFDDGPIPGITPAVLDLLKEYRVKAGFFCIGKNIQGNEAILKRMQDEGHVVGNHSYSHDFWFDLNSAKTMKEDLKKTEVLIDRATGRKPLFFRPPYGVTTPNLRRAVEQLDYTTIGWNIRTLDTSVPEAGSVLKRIAKRLGPGSILLFHDRMPETVQLLRTTLDYLEMNGYKVVPLDELIQLPSHA
jgi:peptidoglycan/xylan/chitin deacetylase (PgdA/CDA1 family)